MNAPAERQKRRPAHVAGILLAGVLALAGCSAGHSGATPAGTAASGGRTIPSAAAAPAVAISRMRAAKPQPPASGQQYFGVQLDWPHDTVAAYDARLGKVPYDFGLFISVPETPTETTLLDNAAAQIAPVRAKLYLTVEIPGGLQTITPTVAQSFAEQLARLNAEGVGIWLRFGQEMNGSWYVWGQQPTAYVAAFREVATYVHRLALGTVMVWSPNYGGGYPFPDETFNAKAGSPQFRILDTAGAAGLSNGGTSLNERDDPYGPYYPGDGYVDWVGLTLYHFGDKYPWGANDVPEANKFIDQVTGNYNGANGNDTTIPNFYLTYAVDHHKPFAISETAALYDTANAGTGAKELALKSDWIHQVFSPTVRSEFPRLALVNWFEQKKDENGITGEIDWRATVNPGVKTVLLQALAEHYIFTSG